ncbi:MAG: hypothetical protein HZR80_13585 [Candidatus Heimdallarchaeota archaeon]
MTASNSRFGKLFSQSAILTVGTTLVALSLFLFKVIFYQKSITSFYSEFLLAYSIYLFYQIFGFMNIGNPVSNDLNKVKEQESVFSKYSLNGLIVVIIFSLIADIIMVINLLVIRIDYQIILFFCIAMFIDNLNNLLIAIFRGLEKIFLSAVLLTLKGIAKPIILFSFSFFMELTGSNIALIFLISEIVALLISAVIVLINVKNRKKSKEGMKITRKLVQVYILQGILLVIISLSIQGFRSLLFIFLKYFVSEDILGFIDVPITFTVFILIFFINIGLMLTVNNKSFENRNEFLKKVILRVFIFCVAFVVVYDIVSIFVTWDDFLLERVFNLDGEILAKGVMILIHSFPFYVIFYLCSGYKQGFRKYYGITFSAVLALLISIVPSIFLVKYLGINGALYGIIIYSIIIALLSFLAVYYDGIDTKLENFVLKIRQKIKKETTAEMEFNNSNNLIE